MAGNATSQPDCRRPLQCGLPTVMALPWARGSRDTWPPWLASSRVSCRIGYHLATPAIAAKARRESIYLDQRFSDHAPLTIDYEFKL